MLYYALFLTDQGTHARHNHGQHRFLDSGKHPFDGPCATVLMGGLTDHQYTNYIIWSQYLPQYYNQSYAGQFAYQILSEYTIRKGSTIDKEKELISVTFAINFLGYGTAGLCRRFLVYPTHAVWPTSLVTIALNSTLHSEKADEPIKGPFGKLYRMGRMRAFILLFGGMFVYFWVRTFPANHGICG